MAATDPIRSRGTMTRSNAQNCAINGATDSSRETDVVGEWRRKETVVEAGRRERET